MAECMSPFGVKSKKSNDTIPVPCGKCPACVARRTSGWSFRLMQEDRVSWSSLFITLTYAPKHTPLTKKGFMSLDKTHVQLFFKRLRIAHDRSGCETRIKYYAAGEYGSDTFRPHYHIILFNANIQLIQPAWDMGHIHYGQVSAASVGYTLKYISKPKRVPLHANDDRIPEFALMSKGLGMSYVTPEIKKYHTSGLHDRMFLTIDGGKKISMPRYYKDKIYNEHQRKGAAMVARAGVLARKEMEMHKGGDNYFRDLAEAHKAAFRRMYFNSQQNEKL